MRSSDLLHKHKIYPLYLFKYSLPSSRSMINLFPDINDNNFDLIELILSLYVIDKNYSESEILTLEARSKEIWNESTITKLEKIYKFLTLGKSIKIDVINKKNKKNLMQKRLHEAPSVSISEDSKICLFSGGMDSSSAILKMHREDINVVPIHTLTNNRNFGLIRKLHNLKPLNEMPIFFIDLRRIQLDNVENDTGNMRGLVYLTNAFIVSQLYGINEIIFPENGPMMINPQTSPWLSPTRNAHPRFIVEFSEVLRSLQPKMQINCIFKNCTKGEILAAERDSVFLSETYSCFSIRQKEHCGMCYACLVRKYSSIAANYVEEKDTYKKNILKDEFAKMSEKYKDFHEAIIFYIEILKNEYSFKENININYVPENFFMDYEKLLKKFSLDMALGIFKECESIEKKSLNILGRFAYNEISKIDGELLEKRNQELLEI